MEEVGEDDGADSRGDVAGDLGGRTGPAVPRNISRFLLLLNHFLPEENKLVWVTMEEMRNRLVYCGVDKSLSTHILANALRFANRGLSVLTRTYMGKVQFYRPVEFAGQPGTPKDQRASENGPPHRRFFTISPSCDAYFQLHPNKNVVLMLKDVNDCLVSLSSALEEQESLRLNAQREATKRCGMNEQKQSNVRRLAISLLLFPSLSLLSDDNTNSVTTHDIPQPSVEYDMDDLSNTNVANDLDDEDCGRACDFDDDSYPNFEDQDECRHFNFEDTTCNCCDRLGGENAECRQDFSHVEGNNGFGFFDIAMLNDFIYRATLHSSKCGAPLNLKVVDKRWGAGIKIKWACVHCQAVLELRNCTWTKSEVVSPTKKRSRMTPEINTRITNGARMNGINMSQIWGLFQTTLDTKIMHPRNLRRSEEKVRVALHSLYEEREDENLRTHVSACAKMDGFHQIQWEHNGETFTANPGPVSMDGAGGMRAYNHRIRGADTALVIQSGVVGVPLMIETSRNKCINCTLALFRQCRTAWHDGRDITIEDLAAMSLDHPGRCYRTSNYSSASAEEFQATKAAERLLFDKNGMPRSADTCTVMSQVIADNDTRGPKNAIKRQNSILGNVADGIAEHFPDLGHVIKNSSNEFFTTRDKDPSFKGKQCLTNEKIKSIHSDISHTVKGYCDYVGIEDERTKCFRQLNCIIRHHCGDHSKCFQGNFCTYIQVKTENPAWSNEEICKESVKRSKRSKTFMSLSLSGIQKLDSIITKRFNMKSIDRIAMCGNSNACELFWSRLVKYSQGKRLLGCGTDLWETMVELTFCMSGDGNAERTLQRMSQLLGIRFTEREKNACKVIERNRKKDRVRRSGDDGIRRRQLAKMSNDLRMGRDANKAHHHKSDKVMLTESSESKVDRCSKCAQCGHKTRDCPVLRASKKVKHLFDWGGQITSDEKFMPRLKRHKPIMYDWSSSTLLNK